MQSTVRPPKRRWQLQSTGRRSRARTRRVDPCASPPCRCNASPRSQAPSATTRRSAGEAAIRAGSPARVRTVKRRLQAAAKAESGRDRSRPISAPRTPTCRQNAWTRYRCPSRRRRLPATSARHVPGRSRCGRSCPAPYKTPESPRPAKAEPTTGYNCRLTLNTLHPGRPIDRAGANERSRHI